MTASSYTLGIDIGGTKVAAAVCDQSGGVIVSRRADTFINGRRDPGLAISLALAEQTLVDAVDRGIAIEAIGIGMPEYVSAAGKVTSREVMEWQTQPADLFASLASTHVPVRVESDVRCGAVAEAVAGAGRGLGSFMYVTVGTGLSSTLVIDGRPWAGQRGEAIAIGELRAHGLAGSDPMNLEAFSSGAGMAARYELLSGKPPAGRVVELAEAGDQTAAEVVSSGALALARALAAMASVLDPAAFIVGGGLGTSRGLWQSTLREAYEQSLHSRPNPPRLIPAALGADSGAIGAALVANRNNG